MSELLTESHEQAKAIVNFELPVEYENIVSVQTSPEDQDGFVRPMYTIDGVDRKVVFVNSSEDAQIPGENEDFSKVPTSPEALLAVAIDARPDDPKLRQMLDNITEKTYTDDETALIDDMSASLAVGPDGRIAYLDQTEGLALVISALIGNEQARELIIKKRKLHENYKEQKQKEETAELKRLNEESQSRSRVEQAEALKWGDVAFVHSTEHDIVRDTDGNVILHPVSYHRAGTPENYPRATIHFTVNSEVESHLQGSWSASNRLIVMGGAGFVEQNGTPARVNVIDTYWSRSPGEPLRLKDATVIEPTKDLDTIYSEDSETRIIRYLDKEEYSDEERRDIYLLQQEQYVKSQFPPDQWEEKMQYYRDPGSLSYNNDRIESLKGRESSALRSIALAAAMRQQGVSTPSVKLSGWSSTNPDFDAAYYALASSQDIPGGIHAGSPEAITEDSMLRGWTTPEKPHSHFIRGKTEVERTVVAYGFILPLKVTTEKRDEDESLA